MKFDSSYAAFNRFLMSNAGHLLSSRRVSSQSLAAPYNNNNSNNKTWAKFEQFIYDKHMEESLQFLVELAMYESKYFRVTAIMQANEVQTMMALTGRTVTRSSTSQSMAMESIKSMFHSIVATYLSDQSPLELNVPVQLKNELLACLKSANLDPSNFGKIKQEISQSLYLNSWKQFLSQQ